MPSKLIVALIAAGAVGAVAIAGVAVSFSSGGATSAARSEDAVETAEFEAEAPRENPLSDGDGGTRSARSGPASEVTINPDDFGMAPDLESTDVTPVEAGSRWGIGKEKLPPPPARACVSEDEFNDAMMGTGCDCSCDGYATQVAGPPSAQCDVACGIAWYVCWAADPTEQEIDDAALATLDAYDDQTRPMMEAILREHLANPEARAGNRGAMMADRAFRWNDGRMCGAE